MNEKLSYMGKFTPIDFRYVSFFFYACIFIFSSIVFYLVRRPVHHGIFSEKVSNSAVDTRTAIVRSDIMLSQGYGG